MTKESRKEGVTGVELPGGRVVMLNESAAGAPVNAREAAVVAAIAAEQQAEAETIAVFESLPNMSKEGARAMVEGRETYSPSGKKVWG